MLSRILYITSVLRMRFFTVNINNSNSFGGTRNVYVCKGQSHDNYNYEFGIDQDYSNQAGDILLMQHLSKEF